EPCPSNGGTGQCLEPAAAKRSAGDVSRAGDSRRLAVAGAVRAVDRALRSDSAKYRCTLAGAQRGPSVRYRSFWPGRAVAGDLGRPGRSATVGAGV
ncbi:ABC transporter, permease protein 2 (cluster 5, nickel/peptides/opines), partial [Pseudomonas sp. FEN]